MNTSGDQKADPPEGKEEIGFIVFQENDIPKSDQQINELQEKLQDKSDRYDELVFVCILFAVIVIDILAFPHVNSTFGITIIAFFELVGLLVLSKRLGIEEPYVFFTAMLRKLSGEGGDKDKGEKP